VIAALLCALAAIAVAALRRPDRVWPEVAWAVCAAGIILPTFAMAMWPLLGGFPAALIAVAAIVHFNRRRGFTIAAARRAAAARTGL
jgi:Na+/H+ antiporter NhaD/arsenite permease-like protein